VAVPTWLLVAGIVAAMVVVAIGIVVTASINDRNRRRHDD
jgi:hypothetical protein